MRTLGLISIAHAVNHAQAVMLPLIFLGIVDEFGLTLDTIAYLAAIGAFAAGMVQLSYAQLTRVVSRRRLLGGGGLLFGGGFVAQAFTGTFPAFAAANIASRIGGSPQHPVGNGILAEQFPLARRGFAISAYIAGGNVGTVVVALFGGAILASVGWRGAAIVRRPCDPHRARDPGLGPGGWNRPAARAAGPSARRRNGGPRSELALALSTSAPVAVDVGSAW
jgi:MFS family permease